MTRVVSVGRSKGLFVASFLGLALLASVTGCPGALENPDAFPPPMSGIAGVSGSAGTGAAGTGAAGVGGGDCDAKPIFAKYFCTTMGACHDSMGSAAGFDMMTAGWETKLVGVMSKGGGTGATASKCMASAMPYIVAKSNPVQGLFVDKLTKAVPSCGAQMPNIGCCLTAAEQTCVLQWATTLANK